MFALFAVLFTFSACGENGGEGNGGGNGNNPTEEVTKVKLNFYAGETIGEDYTPGTFIYDALLLSEGLQFDPNSGFSGDGYLVEVIMYSPWSKTGVPAAGKYNYTPEDAETVKNFDFEIYVDPITDGDYELPEGETMTMNDLSCEVVGDSKTGKIIVKFSDEKSVEYEFTCTAPFEYVNSSDNYYSEPVCKVNANHTANGSEIGYLGATAFGDAYQVILTHPDRDIVLSLYSNSETGMDVNRLAGTYTVSGEQGMPMTVQRGFSKVDEANNRVSIAPSFISKMSNGNFIQGEPLYYVYDGTVVIANNKITVDVTTAFGNTFKATFEGNLSIQDQQRVAPQYSAMVPSLKEKAFTSRLK